MRIDTLVSVGGSPLIGLMLMDRVRAFFQVLLVLTQGRYSRSCFSNTIREKRR